MDNMKKAAEWIEKAAESLHMAGKHLALADEGVKKFELALTEKKLHDLAELLRREE